MEFPSSSVKAISPDFPPPSLSPGFPASPDFPPPSFQPKSPDFPPPNYEPKSPDFPPPSFQSNSSPSFQVGEKVYYRGDGDRVWTIKKVGPRFITIETNNTNGLNLQDSIQVVSPDQIYRIERGPSPFIPSSPMIASSPSQYMDSMPMTGGIHFAPKIIVNGSDNTQSQNPHESPLNSYYEPSEKESHSGKKEETMSEVDFSKPLLIVKK